MLHPQALRDMALFVEVAKRGSFSRAAAELDMPISSLSRRIMLFEAAVGLRLIERTTRKLTLTAHGETYLPRAARLVEEAQRTVEEMLAQTRGPAVPLRIAVPSEPWILRAISAALAENGLPERVLLRFDTAAEAPRADAVDLDLRAAGPIDPVRDLRALADLEIGLYASRTYLDRRGEPAVPHDLDRHQVILIGQDHGAEWRLRNRDRSVSVRVAARIACESAELARRLADDGLGIVAASAVELSDDARLVRVLRDWRLPAIPLRAVTTARPLPRQARGLLEGMMRRVAETATGQPAR